MLYNSFFLNRNGMLHVFVKKKFVLGISIGVRAGAALMITVCQNFVEIQQGQKGWLVF
jgi:hypothetical protein